MTLELFHYQAEAADVMATRDRFGLHDEMGIGKTATTIGTLNRLGARRNIIVAPAMLRGNWYKEFKKFDKSGLRVCRAKNLHDFVAWKRNRFDTIVMSYEHATKWKKHIDENCEFYDAVVFDEAHYLKNTDANRTRAILGHEASGQDGIIQWAEHAYHVTGTPMANDPLDVYTFLRFAKAIDFDSKEFVKYFFEKRATTYGARHTIKEHMLSTLQQLISNNSIRRTHGMVGLELPPIFLNETLIEGDTVELEKALAGYPNLEQLVVNAIQTGNLAELDAPYIATLRRLLGKAKAVPYGDLLKSEYDAGARKRVVFCCHTEPLLYLQRYMKRHGYNFVTVYGEVRDAEERVEAFMNDPGVDGILLNVKKGGVGLTLTVGYELDMFENDWSPANNAQAIKRVHRYGQTNAVRARFITLADSFDETVNEIVVDKTKRIAEIEGHTMAAAPLGELTFH